MEVILCHVFREEIFEEYSRIEKAGKIFGIVFAGSLDHSKFPKFYQNFGLDVERKSSYINHSICMFCIHSEVLIPKFDVCLGNLPA